MLPVYLCTSCTDKKKPPERWFIIIIASGVFNRIYNIYISGYYILRRYLLKLKSRILFLLNVL